MQTIRQNGLCVWGEYSSIYFREETTVESNYLAKLRKFSTKFLLPFGKGVDFQSLTPLLLSANRTGVALILHCVWFLCTKFFFYYIGTHFSVLNVSRSGFYLSAKDILVYFYIVRHLYSAFAHASGQLTITLQNIFG